MAKPRRRQITVVMSGLLLSSLDRSAARTSEARSEIPMPPRSYLITAVVLAGLVAVSVPLTLGFSIILWYGLFAAAACVLAVAGAFKVAAGLRAPPWIGVALASPGLVWAAN